MKKYSIERILKSSHTSLAERVILVIAMSIPAILSQLTSVAMDYIDAGMVGSLGADATASIGLVSTSLWLIGGVGIGLASGFSVQVAHLIGAEKEEEARHVLRQGIVFMLLAGLVISGVCMLISGYLPTWLGGDSTIKATASAYFFIFACSFPFAMFRQLGGSMLQCSGDMKTPSMLSITVCVLDVVFNSLLIFPTRHLSVLGMQIWVPGAGLGVRGAALGSALSEVVVALLMIYFLCIRSKKLSLIKHKGSWRWHKKTMKAAAKIAIPLSFDHIFMCSAYIAATVIVAPLGTVSIAANSLAITAESLCYMPGYGIGSAATAIVGQTIGADRKDLTKSFSRISVLMGMLIMAVMGVIMYIIAPFAFSLLTSDAQVAALGTHVLRLELFAEPLYAASICCAGVFRGAGDTLVPSIMNLVSMWGVRILLAIFLVPMLGLDGYWIAMAIELGFRGVIFLIRMIRGSWQRASHKLAI